MTNENPRPSLDVMQPHLRCKSKDIAPIALVPGDPARVRRIIAYWENARQVACNREFLTYTGTYRGVRMTATSTGIGGPSAAIAVEELANAGVRTFIRVGTCGALRRDIRPGSLILPFAAIRAEGTTREYLPLEFPAVADPVVYQTLVESASALRVPYAVGINRTHDAFYEPVDNLARWSALARDPRLRQWQNPIVSSEMECSVVFLVAMLRGLRSGAVLAVNTVEPFDTLRRNPGAVYELIESRDAGAGIDAAIRVALNAAVRITSAPSAS